MKEWADASNNQNADTKNLQCQRILIGNILGEVFMSENELSCFFIVRIDNVENNPNEDCRTKTKTTCDNTTD